MFKHMTQKIDTSKGKANAPQPMPTRRAKSVDIVVATDATMESRCCKHCNHIFSSSRSLRRHNEEAKYCMLIRTQNELNDLKAEMAKQKMKEQTKSQPEKIKLKK